MKRASLRLYSQRGDGKSLNMSVVQVYHFCVFIYLDKKPRLKTMEQSLTLALDSVFLPFNSNSLQNRNLQSYRLLQTCLNHLDLNRLQQSQNHLLQSFFFALIRHFSM
jgi:hypothetical protein